MEGNGGGGQKNKQEKPDRMREMLRARCLTHQQEGPDVGDLVQLHQQSQGFLVVAAVLPIHREPLPLQKQGRKISVSIGQEEVSHLVECWLHD